MIQIAKKTIQYLAALVRLVWRKLPRMALYGVAIYALFFVGGSVAQAIDKNNIEAAPGTAFLNYTSFTVQNAREGEDITFTLCRDHKENYSIAGVRTVYMVPDGKTEGEKVFIYNKDIKGVVDTGNCQPYFIKNSEYHFTPGKYLITLNVNFKVKYEIEKSVFTKSSIFTIYAQPGGSTDTQTRLNILQQQLQDQQAIIDQLIGNGTIQAPTRTENGPTTGSSQVSNGGTDQQSSINQDQSQAASPNTERQTREVCDPLLNLLGFSIGQINCRQEVI